MEDRQLRMDLGLGLDATLDLEDLRCL